MTRWRPNTRVTFQRWRACDRCGFDWPLDELRLQRGLRVCPECYDEKGHADHLAEQEVRDEPLPSPWEPDEEEV